MPSRIPPKYLVTTAKQLDKSLPSNELESLIERSEVEAIFYTNKYEEVIKKIKYSGKNKLKYLISMDICEHSEGIYSQEELIKTTTNKIKRQANLDAIEKSNN